MKRSALVLLGVLAMSFSTGCCGWWWPGGHYGYSQGYGTPYGGGCPGGNCGVNPGQPFVPPQTSYYNSYDSVQTGVPIPMTGPVTFAPAGYPTIAVPQTAAVPLDSLPTY